MRRLRGLANHLLRHPAQLVAVATSEEGQSLPYQVEPVTPGCGAEVFGFNFKAFLNGDERLLQQIHETFHKYKVLMFRDAGLESEQQLQFLSKLAHHWGIATPKSE